MQNKDKEGVLRTQQKKWNNRTRKKEKKSKQK